MDNRYRTRIVAAVLAVALGATVAAAQQAKMYGKVVDEAGAGAPNVKIILEPLDKGSRAEQISKGKNGSYLIGIIRPGRYAVKVNAEGFALVSLNAEATGLDGNQQKQSKWKVGGRVLPGKPTEFVIEDGMEITCDLVVGKATEITTPTGEKANASGDQQYALLRQQVQKGDCAGALAPLEKFTVDNPAHAQAFYLLGYCNAVQGKDDAALAALAKSKDLDPKFVGLSSLVGKVQARNKRFPEAEAAFQQELEGASLPAAVQFDTLMSLAGVQRDQSKDADAIASFEKAMAAAPTRPEPYVELSTLYTKTGQADKAVAVLDQAKAAGADDPVAMLNVGIAYFNKKDLAHAELMFRRVTESKAGPSDLAMAYGLLGKLQLRNGKNADAKESFRKSLELDPKGRLAVETQAALDSLSSKKSK